MKKYNRINDLTAENKYNSIGLSKEIISLLNLLENINPCGQEYEITDNAIIISYSLKLNLFNFINIFPLSVRAQIIGLPISISEKGYWGDIDSVLEIINQRKGLKILLNGDYKFQNGGRTLSTFVFENKFTSFNEYLNSLRSSYRRRINRALNKRDKLEIVKIDRNKFNEKHYKLYLSIMDRTENPLETLSIDFFQKYDAEIYEFNDAYFLETVAFIQLKTIENKLCFLFGGFHKENNDIYDIYFNMLLKIVEIGIEKNIDTIEFGQTAEESKLKIGCREVPKYLYAHHSNPILNFIIQKLLPVFSYKPYNIKHHVFKENHGGGRGI